MSAKLLDANETTVHFERSGQHFSYPLEDLSEESQKHITSWLNDREQARIEAEEWQTVYRQLEGNLVEVRGRRARKLDDEDLKTKRYFIIYYSASWCGPCLNFTPELVKFYQQTRRKHNSVEFILASSDRSEADMVEYIRSYKMPWPALDFDKRRSPDVVKNNQTGSIPALVVLNGRGEVLATTAEMSRSNVLQRITAILENGE